MEKTILFWSKRYESNIPKNLFDSHRVIEVPDDISTYNVDEVAKAITEKLKEELTKDKECSFKILACTPGAINGILENVIDNVTKNDKISFVVLKRGKIDERKIILDHDTVAPIVNKTIRVDWDKPPDPQKKIYKDDLPTGAVPPPGWNAIRKSLNKGEE